VQGVGDATPSPSFPVLSSLKASSFPDDPCDRKTRRYSGLLVQRSLVPWKPSCNGVALRMVAAIERACRYWGLSRQIAGSECGARFGRGSGWPSVARDPQRVFAAESSNQPRQRARGCRWLCQPAVVVAPREWSRHRCWSGHGRRSICSSSTVTFPGPFKYAARPRSLVDGRLEDFCARTVIIAKSGIARHPSKAVGHFRVLRIAVHEQLEIAHRPSRHLLAPIGQARLRYPLEPFGRHRDAADLDVNVIQLHDSNCRRFTNWVRRAHTGGSRRSDKSPIALFASLRPHCCACCSTMTRFSETTREGQSTALLCRSAVTYVGEPRAHLHADL
jgi:hypothetical protein